jgi:hypothetical protein
LGKDNGQIMQRHKRMTIFDKRRRGERDVLFLYADFCLTCCELCFPFAATYFGLFAGDTDSA